MTEIDRRTLLAAGLATGAIAPAAAGAAPREWPAPAFSVPLWPGEPPGGAPAAEFADEVVERSKDPAIRDRAMVRIRTPRLDVFPAARPNGAAVLIAPGGAYQRVVIDKEGYELAAWLAARGVAAFVLFYRLPAAGWRDGRKAPLTDAQRAMRLIRARAAEWRIDPRRVGVLGFSAGGHVCASLAVGHDWRSHPPMDQIDALDARPLLAAPIYPVISMHQPFVHEGSREQLLGTDPTPALVQGHSPENHVRIRETPPIFLLHAEDDDVVGVENAIRMRAACKAAGVPAELHLFERGGHGFGLRLAAGKPIAAWPELFLAWARTHGLFG